MKRIIYKPALGEVIPEGAIFYTMPLNGDVVDCIVSDTFTTYGVTLYDSLLPLNILGEPPIHDFAGWEI